MIIERLADVERRAQVHAALADPTRLRIVDVLALGDGASSELSARLGTPSNLLAHHLRILRSAGLVDRSRSQGDGRRSYWRLVHHAFEPLGRPDVARADRVVFVCTANSARSQLAAALWRSQSAVPTASAGTEPAERINRGALAAAERHALDLPDQRPRHLEAVVRDGDLVVTVCDRAHEQLQPPARLHWSVPDPVATGTAAAFDQAHDDLAARVRLLAPHVESVS